MMTNVVAVAKTKDNNLNRFHSSSTAIPVANNCHQYRDENGPRLMMTRGREDESSLSMCLSNSIFSDKHLVSLFRSIALYWFFCLNTVFAKGDVLKRKMIVLDCLASNDACTSLLDSNELKFKLSPVVSDCFEALDQEAMCRVILDSLRREGGEEEEDGRNAHNRSLISFSVHSADNRLINHVNLMMNTFLGQFISQVWRQWSNPTTIIDDFMRAISDASSAIVLPSPSSSIVPPYEQESSKVELCPSSSLEFEPLLIDIIAASTEWIHAAVASCEFGGTARERDADECVTATETGYDIAHAIERMSEDGDEESVVSAISSENGSARVHAIESGSEADDEEEDTYSVYSPELDSLRSPISSASSEKSSDDEFILNDYSECEFNLNDDEGEEGSVYEIETAYMEVDSLRTPPQESTNTISYAQMCSVIPKGILEDDITIVREYQLWNSPNILEDYLKRTRSADPTPVSESTTRENSFREYRLFEPSEVTVSKNATPLLELPTHTAQSNNLLTTISTENHQRNSFHVPNHGDRTNEILTRRWDDHDPHSCNFVPGNLRLLVENMPRTAARQYTGNGQQNADSVRMINKTNQQISQNTAPSQQTKEFKMWESPVFVNCLPKLVRSSRATDNQDTLTTRSMIDFERANGFSRNLPCANVNQQQRRVHRHEISFTDGGAFKYYSRAFFEVSMTETLLAKSIFPSCRHQDQSMFSMDEAGLGMKKKTDDDEGEAIEKSEDDDELERNKLNKDYYFRPIQPVYKVSTDPTPDVVRSVSGSLYVGDRKYMTYKHELDFAFPTEFQPKFEVRSNDSASQTNDDQLHRISLDIDLDFLRKNEADYETRNSVSEPVVVNTVENHPNHDALTNVLRYIEHSVFATIGEYAVIEIFL